MRQLLIGLLGVVILAALGIVAVVGTAENQFGEPARSLHPLQIVQYSARLVWADGLITHAPRPGAAEQPFEIQPSESVDSICQRLESDGLVLDGALVRDYLIYTGKDTGVQAGRYRLSASMSIVELAGRLQDATPSDVDFVVLAGWRIEEVAGALPSSGLTVSAEEFIRTASAPQPEFHFLEGAGTAEGFLYPDTYVVPRSITALELLSVFLRNFNEHMSPEIQSGFAAQGLGTYDAVVLASIVQREAVRMEEAPLIASVYLNRLRDGMKLDADPTVQYAIGYNLSQVTWWTNPLSLEDLRTASPYNTYLNGGLPPAPIANPGASALMAVASPERSAYYFFNARCDASGFHTFATTFEEHLANLCR